MIERIVSRVEIAAGRSSNGIDLNNYIDKTPGKMIISQLFDCSIV